MTLLPAWAVQGGSASPEVARAMAFAVTGGQYGAGVVEWHHLKVTANGTSAVRVSPGVAIIPTRYSSSPSHSSYVVVNNAEVQVEVPPTGSGSGADSFLILRIDDPQYGGQVPADPATASYARFSIVGTIDNLPYPFIPLAEINQPPSNTLISTAMVPDARRVSNPRSRFETSYSEPTSVVDVIGGDTLNRTLKASPPIEVPEWATRCRILATYSGLQVRDAAWNGYISTAFGGVEVSDVIVDENTPTGGSWSRTTYATAGEIPITAGQRGANLSLGYRARWVAGSGGRLRSDAGSSYSALLHFTEEPA